MKSHLEKTIRSATDNLLGVREFVGAAARAFGFSEDEASKIVLAVDEACTNIIKHAYQYAPNREIHISIHQKKDRFEIRIYDNGKTFDPKSLQPLDLKDHLTHYRKGGLGVHLMKSLMDKVEYRSASGSRNEVRLVKFLVPLRRSAG